MLNQQKRLSPAKKIAYTAAMCALLIGGQAALSFVSGVEVVTILLLCFSYTFGIVCGVSAAAAFSLLRCFIYGFYPSVIILYLIYYPLFALIFGFIGMIEEDTFNLAKVWLAIVVNVILITIAALSISCVQFNLIKISRLYKRTLNIFLYVTAWLCVAIDLGFNAIYTLVRCKVIKSGIPLKLFFITSIACVCTICFTLLDDVIYPLYAGMSPVGALSYFYASFIAMLPQTVCTIATTLTLFLPLTEIMKKCR